jgi:hypothetical protein
LRVSDSSDQQKRCQEQPETQLVLALKNLHANLQNSASKVGGEFSPQDLVTVDPRQDSWWMQSNGKMYRQKANFTVI